MTEDGTFYNQRHRPCLFVENGTVFDVNYPFTDLTGYWANDLSGKSFDEVLREVLKCEYPAGGLQEPQRKYYFIFTRNHQPREVEIVCLSGLHPFEKICVFCEKPYSRFEVKAPFVQRLIMENLVGAAVFSVPDYLLLSLNQQYAGFLGESAKSPGKLQGKRMGALVPGWMGSKAEQQFGTAVRENVTFSQNETEGYQNGVREILGDGGQRYWDSMLVPITSEGRVKYLVSIVKDVTERVESRKKIVAGNQLIQQQHEQLLKAAVEKRQTLENLLKLKDEFLFTITHEFKTPLTVITAALQTIEALCKGEMPEKAVEYMGKIRQNVYRQIRLVENLLEITRAQSDKIRINRKNMDVVYITRSIVESVCVYARQREIELKFHTTVESLVIGIDEEKYERILLNLLSNAIKFTPRRKSVEVSLSAEERKVCVRVDDEGVGIPSDKLDMIFERFGQVSDSLTSKAEGTGIGLYLVKLLVDAMGGKIKVESEVGKGSSFRVFLPSDAAAEDPQTYTFEGSADARLIQSIATEFSNIYSS